MYEQRPVGSATPLRQQFLGLLKDAQSRERTVEEGKHGESASPSFRPSGVGKPKRAVTRTAGAPAPAFIDSGAS